MNIIVTNKKMTDKQAYDNVKQLYKKYPDMIMKPKKWKMMYDEENA